MNIQKIAGSLQQTTGVLAIAAMGSLLSLPALAGTTSPAPMPKSSSAPAATPMAAPVSAPTSAPVSVPASEPIPSGTMPSVMPKPAASQTSPDATNKVVPTTTTKPGEAGTSTTGAAATTGTIVDVAMSKGSFNTLLTAVKAAGLMDVLAGEGPYTVFAPTDEAFAALPKGTVEMLLKPENQSKLKKLLTYHVVSGSVKSTAIKPGQVKTVEGNSVILKPTKGAIMVNNAKVMSADIKASNGVIHAIDKVIVPPDL